MFLKHSTAVLHCALQFSVIPTLALAQVPFNDYIQAPASRTIRPVSTINSSGNVANAQNQEAINSTMATSFTGVSHVSYDFGKNIGGRVSFNVESVIGSGEVLAFTFTESSTYISTAFCDATENTGGLDVPLSFSITNTGTYTAPAEKLRGGFRYMSVVHNTTGTISLSALHVQYTAAVPLTISPTSYSGYFNSDNEKLNRVWYAGAYTNQMCTIVPSQGSGSAQTPQNWYYNYTLSGGTSVLTDGAKRDRLLWPGDIAVSGPSIYVSIGDADPILNGLIQLFSEQNSLGQLPYVGKPQGFAFSFTYHLHTLIDVYDYFMYTGNTTFLNNLWPQYVKAIDYSVGTIDSSGLAYVSDANDWLRQGMGGHNIEANAILYRALSHSMKLSSYANIITDTTKWSQALASISSATIPLLYDSSSSLFKDNENSTVHPQDGNSYALLSGLIPNIYTSPSNASTLLTIISDSLKARWIANIGAPAPEAGATVSPFASGFELAAHFAAGNPAYALELMEFMWHDFMLLDPRMTNSTFIEGYSTDGSLHYAPYAEDARVSHSHGWSTAPTSLLTKFVAGIFLEGPAGSQWRIEPAMGGLDRVAAGYRTPLGAFGVNWTDAGETGSFETPEGTNGTVVLRSVNGAQNVTLTSAGVEQTLSFAAQPANRAVFSNLAGGTYTISMS